MIKLACLALCALLLCGCAAGPVDGPASAPEPAPVPASQAEDAATPQEPTPERRAWMPGLEQAGEALAGFGLYLVGESHASAKTYTTELELVDYFYTEHQVRTLLLEFGYGSAALVDHYLQTGEAEALDRFMEGLAGSSAYNVEHRQFFEALQAYNAALPAGEKLRLAGVDVEHQPGTGLAYLQRLAPDSEPPEVLAPSIEALNGDVFGLEGARRLAAGLGRSLADHEADYRAYYGENYQRFAATLENLNQGLEYYAAGSGGPYREDCFEQNALARLAEADGPCLALWGSWHTRLIAWPDDPNPPTGARLAERLGTGAGGVASICLVYHRSENMDATGNHYTLDSPEGTALAERAEGPVQFFTLNAADADPAVARLAEGQPFAVAIADSPASTLYG